MNYDELSAEKMRQATEQLKEMQANFKKYGVYVVNREIPEAQTRQDLYNRLDISNVYQDIEAKRKEFEAEINRINKDRRYKEEFKADYKKKMQEEFIKYKTEKLTEVKAKLNGYKTDLQNKYSYKVEDPQLEATQTNNALLQLAFIQQLDNNEEMLKGYINDNWHRSQVMSVVENMYKDNANIQTQIKTKRHEEAKPYELVNKCLNDVTTFINNKDYVVNSSYIDEGITEFNHIGGEK